jgi:hypothetical protein
MAACREGGLGGLGLPYPLKYNGDESRLGYYWAFNKGSGDTVSDKTKNANHGKVTEAT